MDNTALSMAQVHLVLLLRITLGQGDKRPLSSWRSPAAKIRLHRHCSGCTDCQFASRYNLKCQGLIYLCGMNCACSPCWRRGGIHLGTCAWSPPGLNFCWVKPIAAAIGILWRPVFTHYLAMYSMLWVTTGCLWEVCFKRLFSVIPNTKVSVWVC